MTTHRTPSKAEIESYLKEKNNWGRWGKDDQVGAVNLITPQKRAQAAALVRTGRAVSLSREFPKTPAPNNPTPAQHFMRVQERPNNSGAAMDYYGIFYHGFAATHLDALCHVWDQNGLYNGRNPKDVLTFDGAKANDVSAWSNGIVTRGVLLDVPRHRKTPFVTDDRPVHGWELEEIAKAQGVTIGPGDALVVYSGREAWWATNPNWANPSRPGLHASCLQFIRDHDVSVLVWDLMDAAPNEYGLAWSVHGAIFAYGVALVDNALLQPLAEACAQERRYEFMLTVAPLRVVGGTGSPVNPIALF
ncbi:MAG: cyclase family protein [Dehalococcoidia bacterium]|nr:cyclase family protein [Dehalococcoidia bacterium]